MSNLKDIKPSISELSDDEKVSLILASRERRDNFFKKPDKRSNKKLLGSLSQEQKRQLLDAIK